MGNMLSLMGRWGRNMLTWRGTVLADGGKGNYIRLVLLVTDTGTKAVREVFNQLPIFVPRDLTKNLHRERTSREMKAVPPFLRAILFPSEHESKVMNSADFDLTMMTALIDKLYKPTPADVTSWDETKKMIKIIKDCRNILAHSKDPCINDAAFTTIWNKASQAILALVDVTLRHRFLQEIKGIKDIPVGDEEFMKVLKVVKDVLQDLQDDVNELQDAQTIQQTSIGEAKQDQREIRQAQTEMKKEQTEMKFNVDGVQATQTEMKSKLDCIQTGQTKMQATVYEMQKDLDNMKTSTSKGNIAEFDVEAMKSDFEGNLQAYGLKLMKYLKDYYKKYRAGVQCNPLNPNSTMPIKDIYINLVWIKDYHQSDGQSVPLSHYREIFQRHPTEKEIEELITRILVQGKAGVGKTTFSKVLVYDWANENEPYLERFEAIFLLTMRNVKPEQSLVEIVKEQLLRRQPELVEGLKDYIEKSDRCLFVFDGLDELGTERSQEIDDIIKGFYLNNACVLITSRPWLVQDLVLTDQGIDQLVRIEGFDLQNVEMFIIKFFANIFYSTDNSLKVKETSSNLLVEIRSRELLDLVKIPLILNMVCLLFHYENNLPNTMYKLYKKIREFLYKKGTRKSQQDINDLHEILMKLGKLAFKGLLKENDQLFFEYDEVIALVGKQAFEIGLISCEMMKGRMENDTQASFLHKSFQENLAAHYVAQEMEKKNEQPWEEMKNQMSTVKKLRNKALLLEFMAGESLVLYGNIQEYLDVMIMEAFRNGYESQYGRNEDVTQILQLHLKCFKNLQSTLHPEYISDHISCDKELERFAQSSSSVPWIYLEGEAESNPFCFTERTVSLLSQIVDNNTRPCSVYIGRDCQCDLKWMKLIIEILKKNRNGRYKYITFGAFNAYINKYGKEGWEELFQMLLGMKALLGLELWKCDLPVTVLQSLGRIINTNANTLFVLNLGINLSINGYFHMITKEVRTQYPLVLSVLNLLYSLDSSDSKFLSEFLQKTKNMTYLDLVGCKCEVSSSVVELQELSCLCIVQTVNRKTKEGMNLKTILSNLHRLKRLKQLYAHRCEINDSDIETLQVEKLNKFRVIELSENRLSDRVKLQIKEKFNRRGIVCHV